MAEAGILRPDERLELIEGEILTKTPQRSRHAAVISKVETALRQAFGGDSFIRIQMPLALTDESEPEPDLAVVRGAPDDYMGDHPSPALLVVEVADATITYDQTRTAVLYAIHGIPEYWIVNLCDSCINVYRGPKNEGYQSHETFRGPERLAPLYARERDFSASEFLPL